MPYKSKKPCNYPGCPNLITNGSYCSIHSKERGRKYRKTRPDDSFYKTTKWRKIRAQVLREERYCRICGEKAEMVDHTIPIRRGGDMTARENLQALCKSCGNRKTLIENKLNKKQDA